MLIGTMKTARRVAIAIIGGTVLLLGIALILLPGPAILVIPAGLAILGSEFAWARWLLKRMKERTASMVATVRGTGTPKPDDSETQMPPHTAVRTLQPAE